MCGKQISDYLLIKGDGFKKLLEILRGYRGDIYDFLFIFLIVYTYRRYYFRGALPNSFVSSTLKMYL